MSPLSLAFTIWHPKRSSLRSHYPVFHQMEGLRVFSEFELSQMISNPEGFTLFDPDQQRDENQQAGYSTDAMGLLEINLKRTLESLVKHKNLDKSIV